MPLAAQSRLEPVPYSLPATMTSGVPALLVRHRDVVDELGGPPRFKGREAALFSRHHFIAQTNICKRPAHHHFMVAATRAVRVEILLLDAVLDQPFTRRDSTPECCPPARCDPS